MSDKSSFPTRDGIATGKANERQMLERGGMSNEGFRTDLRDNPDGSTTMLRTRGGSPEFSTVAAQRPLDGQPVARGFVAHAFGKSYGALFDPYTLAIEDKRFSIRFATYHVSSVAASAYAPRNWLDVWSWDGATMRINGQLAKTFFPFRFPAAVLQAIPYLRTWPSAPIYGDKWQNSDFPKRIYAVGPESVGIATDPRWASVIAPLKLSPEAPRSENKALVCGPFTNRSTHEATLAQLYFTGEAWDSLVGGWAYSSTKVAMLLTPPYLQATNSSSGVGATPPVLANLGMSYGSMTTDVILPATEVALYGIGEDNAANTPYVRCASAGYYGVVWPWSGTVVKTLLGDVLGTYDRLTYGGESSSSETQAGVSVAYAASNTKWFDSRQDTTRIKNQSVPLGDTDNAYSDLFLTANATDLWVGQDGTTPEPDPALSEARGTATKIVSGPAGISGSYCLRDYEVQTIIASAVAGAHTLVAITATREQSAGEKAEFTGNFTYYNTYLATPYAWIGASSGIGIASACGILPYVDPADIIPIADYYRNSGAHCYDQDSGAAAEINAKYASINAAVKAQILYDSENSDGFFSRAPASAYYTASINPSVTLDDLTLTWSTRDFLLHDETNGVYITVDGHFAATKSYGASASATLTVVLNIETPWGSGSKVLYDLDYTYTDMLPEEEIGSTGKYAIPSPKIMAVFAPKHREQGTFPGAAYVTQDEVGNGAVPAILVNFVLVLEPYSFIGSAETDGQIHLVPVNLLEMLYAYVFSRKYGIDPYQRYPVSDTAAFNTIMAGLFNVQHHIQFRDGAMNEWLIGLGLPYFTEHKTELSRV